MIELLLKYGANVNAKDKYGYSPLRWAKIKDQKEAETLLLNAGGVDDLCIVYPYEIINDEDDNNSLSDSDNNELL